MFGWHEVFRSAATKTTDSHRQVAQAELMRFNAVAALVVIEASGSPRGEAPRTTRCVLISGGDGQYDSTKAASFAMMPCPALVGWMPSQNRNSSGR